MIMIRDEEEASLSVRKMLDDAHEYSKECEPYERYFMERAESAIGAGEYQVGFGNLCISMWRRGRYISERRELMDDLCIFFRQFGLPKSEYLTAEYFGERSDYFSKNWESEMKKVKRRNASRWKRIHGQ